MSTPVITAAVRIDMETARPHLIQALRRISRDVSQSALYSRLASIRDDMDQLIDDLHRAERGLIILPRKLECYTCGDPVITKYSIYACHTCGYIEDQEAFTVRMRKWDSMRAAADYENQTGRMVVA